jgi:LDH2 family malate/lactate/ureidoglycolate dehydrogenase
LIVRALTTVRLPEADATLRAARMTEADRQGVDLRGTVRLPQYGPGIRVAGIRFALDTLRPDTV